VTDRFIKAIEQLGSKELDARIGGIYALERVARDSEKDHRTVMEVLTAFIREHSPRALAALRSRPAGTRPIDTVRHSGGRQHGRAPRYKSSGIIS